MKKNSSLFAKVLAISVLAYWGFGAIQIPNKSNEKVINLKVNPRGLPDIFELDSIIETVRYVQLESTKESHFAWIFNLSFYEDKMLIHDYQRKDALLFKEDGAFIGKIGKKGKGPGEYLAISNVQINPYMETIDVLNTIPMKIISYDWSSREFTSELYMEDAPYFNKFFPVNESQYIISNYQFWPENENWNYHFVLIDRPHANIVKQYLPLQNFERKKQGALYRPKRVFYPQKENISTHFYNSPIIYSYSDQELKAKFYFDFANQEFLSDELIDQENMDRIYNKGLTCCFDPLFEMDNYVVGNYRYRDIWGAYIIYSKRSGKVIEFSDAGIRNPFNGQPFRMPVGYKGDELVFSSLPNKLTSFYTLNNHSMDSKYKEALELELPKINPDGNEVLIFYKLKDF